MASSHTWEQHSLSELAIIGSGSAPSMRQGEVPIMGANGPIGTTNKANFGPGYLVGRVGAAGAINYVKGTCWASDNTLTVLPRCSVCHETFLGHLLQFLRPDRLATRNAQPLITQTNLAQLRVFVPPHLPEQALIAEVLDTISFTIRSGDQIISKLQQVRHGLRHDLLTRGIAKNGKLRDPKLNPELFKDSKLGKLPREWKVRRIGDFGETITGSTPPSRIPGLWEGSLPFITPGEISDDGQTTSPDRFVSQKGLKFVTTIPPGSLLIVCIGSTLGKTAITKSACATNQQINAVIPKKGNNAQFLETAIRLHIKQLLALAGLQAVPIVNRTQFESLWIPSAPAEEQREIGKILLDWDNRIRREQAEIYKLRNLKQGLMDDLLTGRVRVPVLEE